MFRPLMTGVAGVLFAVSCASAHITLEQQQAAVGSACKGVIGVPHGCEGAATGVKPMPGWQLDIMSGKSSRPYTLHGAKLTEGRQQFFLHMHGERGMAEINIEPERGRAKTSVKLLDLELHPLAAKELTLVLTHVAGGFEPIRRQGVHEDGAYWRIDDLRIPGAGRWQVRVEILVSDFEKIVVEEDADLPRVP